MREGGSREGKEKTAKGEQKTAQNRQCLSQKRVWNIEVINFNRLFGLVQKKKSLDLTTLQKENKTSHRQISGTEKRMQILSLAPSAPLLSTQLNVALPVLHLC